MSDINLNEFFANSDELFAPKQQAREKMLYDEIFSFETGNKYLVRLLPYLKEGKAGFQKTSFEFQQYAWRSCKDGRWIYVQSPRTFKEDCPISTWYFAARQSSDPNIEAKVKKLSDNFRRYVYYNMLIVDDPVHPENNGKVKILRAGKQLDDVIKRALSTDSAAIEEYSEELGIDNMRRAVFDLSPAGVNLCIDCQNQGGFPNYKSSRFVRRKCDLGLTDSEIKEILENTYDLTTVNRRVSTEEAGKLFTETFLGQNAEVVHASKPVTTSRAQKSEDIDTTDLDAIEDELNSSSWMDEV